MTISATACILHTATTAFSMTYKATTAVITSVKNTYSTVTCGTALTTAAESSVLADVPVVLLLF